MKIILERAYGTATPAAGYRVLVDRLWPRGVKKEELKLDEWCKEIAPSKELRQWFGHEPERWSAFQERYRQELAEKGDLIESLKSASDGRPLVLIYGARDAERNQAVVLRDVLS